MVNVQALHREVPGSTREVRGTPLEVLGQGPVGAPERLNSGPPLKKPLGGPWEASGPHKGKSAAARSTPGRCTEFRIENQSNSRASGRCWEALGGPGAMPREFILQFYMSRLHKGQDCVTHRQTHTKAPAPPPVGADARRGPAHTRVLRWMHRGPHTPRALSPSPCK